MGDDGGLGLTAARNPLGESVAGGVDAKDNPFRIFWIFLILGCTSFGGPIAHLGYFREALARKRGWMDDRSYADLVALCQFLPGPTSSQAGFALGLIRGGPPGALAAFVGFTLPSAVVMIALGFGVLLIGDPREAGWLKGFKLATVAVVAQAVVGMARTLCPDMLRSFLAAIAGGLILLAGATGHSLIATQFLAIVFGGFAGYLLIESDRLKAPAPRIDVGISKCAALVFGALFLALVIYLPIWALSGAGTLAVPIGGFFRAGSLVFGGGHVVLPMLRAEVATPGHLSAETFLAGYGAAQALPGPLFAFAGYLGTAMSAGPGGVLGGALAIVAIFLPGFLLLLAALPFWSALRANSAVQGALKGVSAIVVGILAAALYDPIITDSVNNCLETILAIAGITGLVVRKVPAWLLVATLPAAGSVLL